MALKPSESTLRRFKKTVSLLIMTLRNNGFHQKIEILSNSSAKLEKKRSYFHRVIEE